MLKTNAIFCQPISFFVGLSCRFGCWLPLAGIASGKLSSGACPNGAGRDRFSRLVFYLNFVVDRFGGGMA